MRHEVFQVGARRAFDGKSPQLAERAGQWVAAALLQNEKAAAWCGDRGIGIEKAAQGELVGGSGGFTVPEEIESEIIEYRNSLAVFRQEARIRLMGSSSLSVPKRTGALAGYYIGENVAPESDNAWGNIEHVAKKPAALTRLSSEMWEDSAADLGAFFVEELSAIFADMEDDAGFNGDGTSTYAGISGICPKFVAGLGGASQLAGAVVATSAHDTFEEIDATDIAALMAALPERYWTSAKFYVSGYGAAKCFARIGATVGGWIMTANGLRPMLSFMGFPIVLSPKLPGSGDLSNRVMIVLGDMRAAVSFGSRKGVSVAVSQNRYFDLDQIGVRGIERYDINCHGLGDSATAGPLVALIGN